MKVDKTKQKICRLEDICVVRTGRKDANHASDNGEYPFFTCGTNPLKSTTYSFDGENLIIPGNGDIGRCFYYNGKIEAYQRTYVLHLKENSNIDIKYLYLVFKAGWKLFVKNKILGAAMPYIKLGHLNSFPITIYELGVQKAIATELDSIQTMIDGYKAQLADLDALAQSIFLDTFGKPSEWNNSKLIDVCNKITDGTHNPPQFTEEGIPFIFVSNIINNEITYNTQKFINEETYNELWKSTPVECGDIVYTSVGSYGNPAIVKSKKKFMFQRHIALIKPKHDIINSQYLKWFLISPLGRQQADDRSIGVAQKTLNLKVIKNFDVPIPPLPLQQQFAEHVEAIEKQKDLLREQLKDAETLMAERMQYYFS